MRERWQLTRLDLAIAVRAWKREDDAAAKVGAVGVARLVLTLNGPATLITANRRVPACGAWAWRAVVVNTAGATT